MSTSLSECGYIPEPIILLPQSPKRWEHRLAEISFA